MTKRTEKYIALLKEINKKRVSWSSKEEKEHLDNLDRVWDSMSEEEQEKLHKYLNSNKKQVG